MSRENVDLALRAFEAVNRRDLDAFLALMDDDVEGVTRIAVIEGWPARPRRNAPLVGEPLRG
jgi:ketosteroid isomerase-like protein